MATLKEILADETVAKELAAQETPEAALAYLQGKGVEITMTELKTQMEEILAEAGELSEDDLEKVAGGESVEERKERNRRESAERDKKHREELLEKILEPMNEKERRSYLRQTSLL